MTIIFDGTQGITTPTETANNSVTTPVVKSSANLVFQSNGTTEAMRIDTSGNVGVGTATPSRRFELYGPSIAGTGMQITSTSGGAGIKFVPPSGSAWEIQAQTVDQFSAYNRSTDVYGWRIDSAGRITMPYQPCFLATRTSGSMTTNGQTVVFNSVQFNTGSHYNSTNGRFTAPIAGNYLFTLSAITDLTATQSYLNLYKNNSFYGISIYAGGPTTYYKNLSSSFILNLAASDYIEFIVGTNTGLYAAGDGGNPRFAGCLLN